ncbi:hypothetical protein L1987_21374 [Smallanthus sonchifolius]|uniref:Uncharacterized protein n=1 Tax=Smallanthus sonchifolius TaxID=185202 RepID=A0ACB9IVE2_9ASTR|nr:hypothetical protein L1987_21374 [Smallanthus sonchifolius]
MQGSWVGLRPFKKLTGLAILYYKGTEFPSWVGVPSFACLTQLTLRGCISCTSLQTLGQLPSLQILFLESMYMLKRLGSVLLRPSNSFHGVAFPSLQVLKFKDMEGCLREIAIINCPKLDLVAIEFIQSLQVLHVEGCSLVVLRSMVSVSSSITRLTIKNIKGLTQLQREVLEHLRAVEYLHILKCDEVTYLWESEAAGCNILLSLQKLELDISNCNNLKSFPHKHLKSLTSLKSLRICFCPSLDYSFRCGLWPPNLRNLEIGGLKKPISEWEFQNFPTSLVTLYLHGEKSGVVTFAKAEEDISSSSFLFPSSLTSLEIYGFMELESLPEGMQHFMCLQHLGIYRCPKLRDLPETLLPSLSCLSVDTDSSMKLRKKSRSRKGMYWPIISQIPLFDLH